VYSLDKTQTDCNRLFLHYFTLKSKALSSFAGSAIIYHSTMSAESECSAAPVRECQTSPTTNKCLSWLNDLTLNLPTTTIVAQPFNIIKWQLKFNPVA